MSAAFPGNAQWRVADYTCLPLRGQCRIFTGFPSTCSEPSVGDHGWRWEGMLSTDAVERMAKRAMIRRGERRVRANECVLT